MSRKPIQYDFPNEMKVHCQKHSNIRLRSAGLSLSFEYLKSCLAASWTFIFVCPHICYIYCILGFQCLYTVTGKVYPGVGPCRQKEHITWHIRSQFREQTHPKYEGNNTFYLDWKKSTGVIVSSLIIIPKGEITFSYQDRKLY